MGSSSFFSAARARPQYLHVNLTRQREQRRAVDLGVPQARHQVGRAGAGNRQTGGGFTRYSFQSDGAAHLKTFGVNDAGVQKRDRRA